MPQIIIRDRAGSGSKTVLPVNPSDKIIDLAATIVQKVNKSATVEVTETEVIIDLES